ncbi:hypothetical protein D0469_18260 [Peribacillus saganii]|uniref:VOC domain-containing protein n=1 Tax=Peribacillus saganii TaxID=2303992 RepID=A0A372LE25_9BACI|nr:hypothetical protein [Peribacillus saganii]RFU64504.1 hypothetical protein D0469_18260 [Peribacillus saganii]
MLNPGINHIEFWVSVLEKSLTFYSGLFEIISWKEQNKNGFRTGSTEIFFKEANISVNDTIGTRYICFQAVELSIVDQV